MTVPKTTVHHDYGAVLRQYNVWFSRKLLYM